LSISFDGKNISWKSENMNGGTLAFLQDFQGRKWIAKSSSGFVLYDKNGELIPTQLQYKGRFPDVGISDFFQDRWGGIWIGSSSGLSYTHPQLSKFNSFSDMNAGSKNGFDISWSIYSDDDKNFILGSDAGLFEFNSGNYEHRQIKFESNVDKKVYCFLKTKDGKLLAGTSQGIVEIDQQIQAMQVFPQVSGFISTMVQLPDGDILAGAYDERGMYRINPKTGAFRLFQHEKGNPNSLINSSINLILIDEDKKVLIGTDMGLSKYDPENDKFDNSIWESRPKSLKISQLIYGLANFKDQLWIGTFGSGILIFDKQTRNFTQLGLKEGLPNESIYQLQSQGDIVWASTNKGMAKIDRQNLKIRVFTEGDGLQSDEYNHFSSFGNCLVNRFLIVGNSCLVNQRTHMVVCI
jgi:ligand-binding sensor domain-containing protein